MKRLEFVRNISLIGAGLSLAPINLFANNSKCIQYRLPEPVVHIPHGNFYAEDKNELLIPEVGLIVTVERFMKHGIEASSDDLTVFTLVKGRETLNLAFRKQGSTSCGTIKSLEVITTQNSAQLRCQGFQFELSEKTKSISLKSV
jgi:hypothetical protein